MYLKTRSQIKHNISREDFDLLLRNKRMKKQEFLKIDYPIKGMSHYTKQNQECDFFHIKKDKRKNQKKNHPEYRFSLKNYVFEGKTHYEFMELVKSLKIYTGLDYENLNLKDEEKQEYQSKANEFLSKCCRILDNNLILFPSEFLKHFLEIFQVLINNYCQNQSGLNNFKSYLNLAPSKITEKVNFDLENLNYIPQRAFLSETHIKPEELSKKKIGQYLKYKTVPKWHHYALDMLSQITHSRNSFIFSKQIKDDDNSENPKKSLDIETVSEKLKYKVYSDINEFYDEVNKMIKHFKEYMIKRNNIKNANFCKSVQNRLMKYFSQLKAENKI